MNNKSKDYKSVSSEIRKKIADGEKARRTELKKSNTAESKNELHFMDIDAKTEHDTPSAANEIWEVVKPLRLTPWMSQPYDIKVDMFHKKFPKFCTTFPVVIKYMINDGIFSRKAFDQYLNKLKNASPRTKEEWAERQADYVKYCFLDIDKKPGKMKRAVHVWKEVKQGLMEDMDDMTKEMETAKKNADAEIKELADKRREELKNMVLENSKMKEQVLAKLTQKAKDKKLEDEEEKNPTEPKTVWMTMEERDKLLKEQQSQQ